MLRYNLAWNEEIPILSGLSVRKIRMRWINSGIQVTFSRIKKITIMAGNFKLK